MDAGSEFTAGLKSLLQRVGLRMAVARFGRTCYFSFLACAALFALLLLLSRLCGVWPEHFSALSLLLVPVAGLLAGVILWRRPTPARCARAVDKAEGTEDLFLTAVLSDEKAQEFTPLVRSGAESRSEQVVARKVVSWDFRNRAMHCLAAALVLVATERWLPQLDPFGKEEQRQQKQKQHEELARTRKATEIRKARLKKHQTSRELSEQTEQRITELKQTFARMKPDQKKGNFEALTKQQQQLGKQWQKAQRSLSAQKKMGDLSQAFGSQSPKSQQWRKQLSEGSTKGLQQEMQTLKDLAEQIKKMPDGAEKQAMQRELARRTQELSRFAKQAMSPAISSALSRALAQAKLSNSGDLSAEALQAMAESMDLSQMELSQLQQAMNDAEALEEALKALQMAQMANQQDPLDGDATSQCDSMASYAELYQQMMAQGRCGSCEGCKSGGACTGGAGTGQGMSGAGTGEGGDAIEDPYVETDYASEKSKSNLRAGKILMQWESGESADSGKAAEDYDQQIQQLRESVSEAVKNEQIPPAYHATIRRYFDALGEDAQPGALDEGNVD